MSTRRRHSKGNRSNGLIFPVIIFAAALLVFFLINSILSPKSDKQQNSPSASAASLQQTPTPRPSYPTEGILLVNAEHPLPSGYVPGDLVCLYNMRHSFRLSSSDIYLTRECYEAMEAMFAAAEKDEMNGYTITSGYRSYERQKEIYAESDEGYAQLPGCSEHQTGLCFDVTCRNDNGFENTPQYAWLCENAYKYGFIQRYPADKTAITGIEGEAWHYRYVGTEAAAIIHDNGICLEEYFGY